jgi:hypothetical protein
MKVLQHKYQRGLNKSHVGILIKMHIHGAETKTRISCYEAGNANLNLVLNCFFFFRLAQQTTAQPSAHSGRTPSDLVTSG